MNPLDAYQVKDGQLNIREILPPRKHHGLYKLSPDAGRPGRDGGLTET